MFLPFASIISNKLLQPEQDQNGEPNAFHLLLGMEGFRFQSRVFRLPTRLGPFSRGPRELQAYEGSQFALLLYQIILWLLYAVPLLALGNFIGFFQINLCHLTFQVIVAMAAYYWAGMIIDPHRNPENFHAVWRADGWRVTDLEDRLRQATLQEIDIRLKLRKNELEWERLQRDRAYQRQLRHIEEEILESDEEPTVSGMIDVVESLINNKTS